MAKNTCPKCQRRVSERAAYCRGCGYAFPEKASPWSAGPALGAGFPLVMMGVMTMIIAGSTSLLVALVAGAMFLVGLLLFFHPR